MKNRFNVPLVRLFGTQSHWLCAIAFAAVIGFSMTACPAGDGDGGESNGENLPASKGANAVSGKMFYESQYRTVFSTTADGAKSGTYVVYMGTDGPGGKYTYTTKYETGYYSWNEEAKTVTLKPEYRVPGFVIDDIGSLQDRAGYRSEMQAMINSQIKGMSQAEINKQLASIGFSSVAAYIDFMVSEAFANRTRKYSFSVDGNALLLEDYLPANKGANELSGQTYYGLKGDDNQRVKDESQKYVFTASGYTYTYSYSGTVSTITGSYAYDSIRKIVYLGLSTIDGKDMAAYYEEQTVYSGHHYPDDYAYRAAQTNNRFWYSAMQYNSTNKTLD
ncbi:MAG: hypothetical protein LBU85_08075 [Treponema sp.]|jgi:hypothetical protein|nr:hypothetical protein [Treponema sp.]